MIDPYLQLVKDVEAGHITEERADEIERELELDSIREEANAEWLSALPDSILTLDEYDTVL